MPSERNCAVVADGQEQRAVPSAMAWSMTSASPSTEALTRSSVAATPVAGHRSSTSRAGEGETVVSSRGVFNSLANERWKLSYKWAKHSHPNKPKNWVVKR